jgi:UDP-GlcNAc:undecaprenyl-phosphate GlcNAc-1-phosphate transferase
MIIVTSFLISLSLSRLPPYKGNPVPTLGGIAIFLTFALFSFFYDIHFPFVVPITCMFVVGVIDDALILKWWIKLLLQILICIYAIAIDGFVLHWAPALSLLWLIGLTNAYNLLDNMDGLCPGVVIITGAFIYWMTGNETLLILIGSLLGFLVLNYPRGTIWLGDGGSLPLGLAVALLVGSEVQGTTAPLFLTMLPIADTTFVTCSRLLKGKKPWVGGKDHLSHVLARKIGNETWAVFGLWALNFLCCYLATEGVA